MGAGLGRAPPVAVVPLTGVGPEPTAVGLTGAGFCAGLFDISRFSWCLFASAVLAGVSLPGGILNISRFGWCRGASGQTLFCIR